MAQPNGHIDPAALRDISLHCGVHEDRIEDVYNCTPFQQGIAADSGKFDATYAARFVLSIPTNLDITNVANAISELVALNTILRTRIVDDQQLGLVQVILRDDPATRTRLLSTGLDQYVEDDRRTSMGLAAPLFRSTIIEDVRKWVLTIHHSIFDWYFLRSLLDDVTKICAKQPPTVHASYKQFVEFCGSVQQSEARAFWAGQFTGTPSVFPSVSIGRSSDASSRTRRRIRTPGSLASPALMPVYLECAWALLAHAYGGGDSVAYGVVYSGRSASTGWEGVESTLGPTIATVPVEVALDPSQTVGELLKRRQLGRQAVQGCGAALHIGLNNICKISESAKKASQFQTVINILNSAVSSKDSSSLCVDYEDDFHRAYAIGLTFGADANSQEWAGGFEVLADFDESLVSPAAMNRLLMQLEHVLQTLARAGPQTRIGDLTLMSSRDHLDVLKSNKAIAEPVGETLHSMVRKMAITSPDDVAVDAWDGRLTYLELMTMAESLAETLLNRGVPRQSVIPCLFEHSRWAVVAALAVLTVGGICINLEPSHPRARHEKLLDLTKPYALLCSATLVKDSQGLAPCVLGVSAETVNGSATLRDQSNDEDESEQDAFIVFTSGSTGTPKGVVLQHRALTTSLTSFGRRVGWRRGLRVLQFAAYIWDASIAETFITLLFGGCVCIPSGESRESGLADYINTTGVELMIQTPSGMRNLSPDEIPTVKTLVSGGERVSPEAAVTWGSKLRLVNGWGPCEASIAATFADLGPESEYPDTIGTPCGSAVWLADPENPARLVPVGAVGELIIEGAAVARGYFYNKIETAAVFIDTPAWAPKRSTALTKARRFYRTGDLAKYNDDGSICFLGRRDHQIKIRGQRLELGEIEDVVAQCPEVRSVAVVAHMRRGLTELVAVLTLKDSQLPRGAALQGHMDEHRDIVATLMSSVRKLVSTKLPTYMEPAHWIAVQTLPHALSNKIDRKAIECWLKKEEPTSNALETDDEQLENLSPPESFAEKTLQTVWSTVLDIPETQIGRESSFLKLGGDSITAMQVATRSRRLGMQLSVQTLMQHPTLCGSAAACKKIKTSLPNATQSNRREPSKAALSPIQDLLMRNDGPAANSHFNQSWLLQLNTDDSATTIETALQHIVNKHSMLRARASQTGPAGQWEQSVIPASTAGSWRFHAHRVSSSVEIQQILNTTQTSFDLERGPVFAADLIINDNASHARLLFIAAHHLACDIVSWQIILEDLETLLTNPSELSEPTVSFLSWVEDEEQESASRSPKSTQPSADLSYWEVSGIPLVVGDTVQDRFVLDTMSTQRLMGDACNQPLNTKPKELMLASLLTAFQEVFPERGPPALYIEGHGRGVKDGATDVSRTVGWFTTIYPIFVELKRGWTSDQAIIATKDCHRSALKHENWFRDQYRSSKPTRRADIELLFNFAGHLPSKNGRGKLINPISPEDYGVRLQNIANDAEQVGLLNVFCFIQDHKLHFWIDYNKNLAHQARIKRWVAAVERSLCRITNELPAQAPRLTVSDVPALESVVDVDIDRINQRLGELQVDASNVETIYPCSAVQEGILFAQLKGQGDEYRNRFTFRMTATELGDITSVQDLEQAWRSVCKAHSILRTVFVSGLDDGSAFQQIVLREAEPTVKQKVLDSDVDILKFLKDTPKTWFRGTVLPHCLTLVQQVEDCSTYAVFELDHAIVDAKAMHIIGEQFTMAYQRPSQISKGLDFSDYITWLRARRESSRQYWLSHLSTQKPCLLRTVDVPPAARPTTLRVDVPYNNAAKINSFCQHHGVTIASFAQVAWALVLKRYSIDTTASPCFGTMHSGRDVIEDAEDIMGPLVTMLVTRFETASPLITPLDLMNQARQDFVEGSDKVGCSLGEVHEYLGLGASLLFNSIMTIQPAWPSNLASKESALSMVVVQADDPTEYPVTVAVGYSKESFQVRLTCKPEIISSAFAEELAQCFAIIIESLLSSPNQPLSTMESSQQPCEVSLRHHDPRQLSQYWPDHLNRVQRVSAFPSKMMSQRALKDTCRSRQTNISVPEDQSWIPAVLQASWALCLSRLTGNSQVLFGVASVCRSEGNNDSRDASTAIVPYAVHLTECTTTHSLSEDARIWAQDSRPFILEGRDYIRRSRGAIEPAGHVNNVLSIRTSELGADSDHEPHLHEHRLLPVSSHPDDWGFSLAMSCEIEPEGVVSLRANFDSLLMDARRADLILRQYEHCISQMFQSFGTSALLVSLNLLGDEERSIIRQWTSKPMSTADVCIHDEISQRAYEHPDYAAVNAWDGEISFRELEDLSTRLASQLVSAGVRIGTYVPFFFEKSTAAVVAMIAVMKSGGVFVPMDIKHPEKRRAVILAELESPIVICCSSWQAKLGDLGTSVKTVIVTDMAYVRNLPVRHPNQRVPTVSLEDICYITFTSGSTGKPKGIVVDHSNIATSIRSYRLRLGMSKFTRTLQYVALTFDVSFSDIFMTLLAGGCIFMPTEDERADAAGITNAINRTCANWLCLTPSLATLLVPEDVTTIETLVLIGEAMRTDLVEAWADRLVLVNAYAPSEASIEASLRLVRRNTLDPNNIGTPNDCLYWVVDENDHNRLLPIGCPGELLIQGPNVTRGYLHNPEKTEAAFIKHPAWMKDYPGAGTNYTLYKTGDIVEQHVDGSVTYLGRSDSQFKLRGQRVDIGEIEHHLREHVDTKWQVAVDVVHWEQEDRDPSLVCFLAGVQGASNVLGASALVGPDPELASSLRAALTSVVPIYMVPDFFIFLKDLPSAPSGKTDRKALRSIAASISSAELMRYTANSKRAPNATDGASPKSSSQGSLSSPQASQQTDKFAALQRACSYVLNIPSDSVSKEDDWFSIGGNSIKAMKLVAAARKDGLRFTVVDVFNNPVLKDLELVASFGTIGKFSQPLRTLRTRNEDLFPRVCASAPFVVPENIESVAIATDAQAWMLASGEVTGKGWLADVYVDCKDGLNVGRLTSACAEVIRHHPVLRTIFVQLDDILCQVVLKQQYSVSSDDGLSLSNTNPQEYNTGKQVPCFFYENLSSDGHLCHRLRLSIDHTLYDAIFIQMVMDDVAAAYCNRPLTRGPSFHTWVEQVCARDFTTAKSFWKNMLEASTMTFLQPPNGPCRHENQSESVSMSVPVGRVKNSVGTEASVVKAAWATVLARELGVQDVIFAQVTANRSSEFLETDQVLGPCLNFLPVRARPSCDKEFNSLVQEIGAQHRASVPHHDLGFREIVRDCTDWPSWTRWGSILVFQNHGSSIDDLSSVHDSTRSNFRMGDTECVLSGYGEPPDACDIFVIAEQDDRAVNIHLRYAPSVIPMDQAERLARNLTTVLETGHLDPLSPSYNISPADSTWSLCVADSEDEINGLTRLGSLSTEHAQTLTFQAWREVKLLHNGVTPEAHISMFDCQADVVTALLLSRVYQRHGYAVGVADIVRCPTQRAQGLLLDNAERLETKSHSSEVSPPAYEVRAVGPPK